MSVWAEKGYVSAAREAANFGTGKVLGCHAQCAQRWCAASVDEDLNRTITMVRARVKHPFRVSKQPFGCLKTRYRGIAKNRAQLFNLFLVQRRLLA